jgi:signal peptidase I
MNDNHENPDGHDNRFSAPEPERFEPPRPQDPAAAREQAPPAETPAVTEHATPVEHTERPHAFTHPAYPEHSTPPVHGFAEGPEHVSSTLRGYPAPPLHGFGGASGDPAVAQARSMDTDALLPVDPLLPSEPGAGALAAQERLALDSTSLWLNRLGEELVAWLKTLASAAVYATLIVTFGFQVARVEGMSMAPTLQDQDRLIVNKLAYRIGDPKVGDIVMLYYPLKPEKSFVKRIIAEEGDQVRIVDGRVFRNDVPLDDSFVPQEYRSHDDWGPQVIPEGYYFVMGDHRNNSSDSRHWGFVPKKYIIGKVQLRWWPMGHAQVF